MPSAPPILWVLGCLALLLWLWVLCTACYRYVCPLSGFHVEPDSALWPEGAGLQAGPPWTKGWGPRSPSLLPWPHHPLAPRKRARRQQAEPQGSAVQVSARLSPGQGGVSMGPTSLPCPQSLLRQPHLCSLSKSDTRLHELCRGPPVCRGKLRWDWEDCGWGLPHRTPLTHPSDLYPDPTPSSAACQHGSLAPAMSGGVQRHHQAPGGLLTPGTAPARACYLCRPALHQPRGHLFQCGAGCDPQGQPGSQPCRVGRGPADQQLCQTWA